MASSNVLSMEGVGLSFKDKRVLRDLTFAAEPGEVFGFLGPSGAGKTTTIKLLTRQLVKDEGSIELFGRPIEEATSADYERIGILSDTSALYERMSIEQNLQFYARIRGVGAERIPALLGAWASPTTARRSSRTAPKACASGRASWRRSCTRPSCSSWTSPPAASTPRPAPRCTR